MGVTQPTITRNVQLFIRISKFHFMKTLLQTIYKFTAIGHAEMYTLCSLDKSDLFFYATLLLPGCRVHFYSFFFRCSATQLGYRNGFMGMIKQTFVIW